MNRTKNIVFLSGFMGSGKSTIGPRLAKKLGYDFIDVDYVIEENEGITIPEIFASHGEKHFRTLEKEILTVISRERNNIVVALGGGTLTHKDNRELVKKDGILIYLKAAPEEILERVEGGKIDRPMLLAADGRKLSGKELSLRIESLLKEREEHYTEASIIIETSGKSVRGTIEEITSKLKGKIL
ncbi:MAG TPA: shikimate kinase [Candidatus Acidoferrales bacterium]|nr:shikimate kinase [Candidatus Acidoferrales bacterium]